MNTKQISNAMSKLRINEFYHVMGCPCASMSSNSDAIKSVKEFIEASQGGYTVAINAEKVMLYCKDPTFKDVIDNSILPYPDGFGAVLGMRWLHGVKIRKINMPIACLEGASKYGWKTFVLGSTEEVNFKAVEEIKNRYPMVDIVGRINGYADTSQQINEIKRSQPQLILAALGSPKQEMLAVKIVEDLPGAVVVGCGGALDILSGAKKRAPSFFVEFGLEWLYRVIKEPWRAKRQKILPIFLFKLFIESIRFDRRT